METKDVHIDTICRDDVVFHDGKVRTVGKNLRHGGLCGTTLWGDSYRLGTVAVKLVVKLD